MAAAKRDVVRALSRCQLTDCEGGALKAGVVIDLLISEGTVTVLLVDHIGGPKGVPVPPRWVDVMRAAVAAVPGVTEVRMETRPYGTAAPSAEAYANSQRPKIDVGSARVLAVASGKGGVGKSTVTANLAVALAELGCRVGVVDADIYGFSMPTLLGAKEPPRVTPEKRWIPAQAWGVGLLSMDFFAGPSGDAVVWRGPMLGKALKDFVTRPLWGQIDFLLLDLPPGTGDMALDVHEMLPGCLEIVVTTPDPMAARVAIRAGKMAHKTGHTVLGVVENMAWMRCPHGEIVRPFGKGGGDLVAGGLGVPILCQVPMGDAMRPGTGLFQASSEPGRAFAELAQAVRDAAAAGPSTAPSMVPAALRAAVVGSAAE